MAAQRTLFESSPSDASGLIPKSRRTDPLPSKLAARSYTRDAGSDRSLILAELHRKDGQTAGEIAKHLGPSWTNVRVSRRLPELERLGLINRGKHRTCEAKGTAMVAWFVKR